MSPYLRLSLVFLGAAIVVLVVLVIVNAGV